ncbi:YchJ family protein [Xanthovirga aplysinae]|uniref:YchJ family protein n=1 Tax=Xanthovirga aplysinae TaxID=2529853 RepID=UPI001FE25849|nr:YchJ family protein [Xanthovirga aplysinae]
MKKKCPCGSARDYNNCCGKFIKGEAFPNTAEELMRSRYTAFVKMEVDYLVDTSWPENRTAQDRREIKEHSKDIQWVGLEIVKTEKGQKEDQKGGVEFKAYYLNKDGKGGLHHENSEFRKQDGKWYYVKGVFLT